MSWDDPLLVCVLGDISGDLENLRADVFHDGGHYDGCALADSLVQSIPAKEALDSANGESDSGLLLHRDFGTSFSGSYGSLGFGCWHCEKVLWLYKYEKLSSYE